MFEVEGALIIEGANALLGDSCTWKLELVGDAGGRVGGIGLYHGDAAGDGMLGGPSDEMSGSGALGGPSGAAPGTSVPRLLVADSIPAQAAAPVCVPPRECSVVRAYDLLQAAFDACRTWYEDCLRLICGGAEIDAVLDAAAQDMANPVACLDETGALVCRSGAFANQIEGTLWENIVARGYSDPRFLTDAEQMRISHQVGSHEEVVEGEFENDPGRRFVIVPLFDGGDFRGSLVSIDINGPLTPGQKGLMRLAGQLVLLAGGRKAAADAVRGTSYYVRRLLEGGADVKRAAVERHFARKGWAADDSYLLFRFEAPDFASEETLVSLYERELHEVLPDAMWVRHEGGLVALGRKKDFDATDAGMRERLEAKLEGTRVQCGISSCFIGLAEMKVQHIQCQLALRAMRSRDAQRVGYFDELYPQIVRYELDQVSSMRSLCHPAVLHLIESGQDQDEVRLATLRTFLLNGRNVAASSRALGIHRNTMLYRLEKIQEEIGQNLYELDEPMLTYLFISCLLVG